MTRITYCICGLDTLPKINAFIIQYRSCWKYIYNWFLHHKTNLTHPVRVHVYVHISVGARNYLLFYSHALYHAVYLLSHPSYIVQICFQHWPSGYRLPFYVFEIKNPEQGDWCLCFVRACVHVFVRLISLKKDNNDTVFSVYNSQSNVTASTACQMIQVN